MGREKKEFMLEQAEVPLFRCGAVFVSRELREIFVDELRGWR